jgi:hypothetical protein
MGVLTNSIPKDEKAKDPTPKFLQLWEQDKEELKKYKVTREQKPAEPSTAAAPAGGGQ